MLESNFDDVKSEYHSEWSDLKYDFFIPSLNTAVEVKSIQHFKGVDYFGGEDGFKKQMAIELRKQKRSKAARNNRSVLYQCQ